MSNTQELTAHTLVPYQQQASQQALDRARQAAASLDVLSAQSEADALELAAAARRRGLRGQGAELALKLIVCKLERAVAASSNPATELPGLEPLVRTVVGLDPEQKQQGGRVTVEVVYRKEDGSGNAVGVGVSIDR